MSSGKKVVSIFIIALLVVACLLTTLILLPFGGTAKALDNSFYTFNDNYVTVSYQEAASIFFSKSGDLPRVYSAPDTISSSDDTLMFYDYDSYEFVRCDGTDSSYVSNITIDFKEGKVKFNVALPEKQSTMPILTSKNIQISKFLDGNSYLLWNSDVKSGTAHVLVVRATERLKNLAEAGKSGITIENFKSEKADELPSFKHYDTVYSASVPLAEKFAILPKFEDEVLIFIAIESQSGSCAVRYVGCIENLSPSFGQFLYLKIDAIYYTYFAFGVILLTIVVTIVYYKKGYHKKGR